MERAVSGDFLPLTRKIKEKHFIREKNFSLTFVLSLYRVIYDIFYRFVKSLFPREETPMKKMGMKPNSHLQAETAPATSEENQNHLAAIKMIPPEEYDGPLSLTEIEMRFGSPVIYEGTDFTKMSKFYGQAVYDEPADAEFLEWQSIPLSEYAKRAESSLMEYCQRLMAICDRLDKQNVPRKDVYAFLKEHHGYNRTDRTLSRQLAHGKLGLVLAAAGKIDLLPSQNVAGAVCGSLPRFAWSLFLERHQIKDGEPGSLRKKIESFAAKNNITLRGRPVDRKEANVWSLMQSSNQALLTVDGGKEVTVAETAPPKAVANSKPVPFSKLCRRVAVRMHQWVPASHLRDPEKLAKNLMKELKDAQKRVPRKARHASLDSMAEEMLQLDPVRARAISQAAMRLFYGQALDEAIRRAESGKK